MRAQTAVTNMTNDLLKKNSEMLHTSTVEVAKGMERGIVDIETLKQTNETLIKTFDEVANSGRRPPETRRGRSGDAPHRGRAQAKDARDSAASFKPTPLHHITCHAFVPHETI